MNRNPAKASLIRAYFDLTKPRLAVMVLIMAAFGFYLSSSAFAVVPLLFALLGTGLVAAGGLVLNNYLERDIDARMERTKNRALPMGTIRPQNALSFGVLLVLGGLAVLIVKANLLAAFLALLSAFLYVVVYTPMKRLSWLNTSVGAIPGALPPVIGAAAASGRVDLPAIILFALLFLWQHPHFYAIAWMYREDYRKGGFKMLTVTDPGGGRAFRQSVYSLVLLIPVSLLPVAAGMAGGVYAAGAALLGLGFLATGIQLARLKTDRAAKRVLHASLLYLPALFLFVIMDSTF